MADVVQKAVDLDPDLKDAFLATARAEHRLASEIMLELIAHHVRGQVASPDCYAFFGAQDRQGMRIHERGARHCQYGHRSGFCKVAPAIFNRDA